MPTTLAESIVDNRIDMGTLRQRYRSQLELVNILIGVVPNCDPYLEIWPPGFRTYNLVVPNFLNLPAALRSKVKGDVGLGMYVASRAAGCAYCSAHSCSFALRRGSAADAIAGEARTPAERAVAAFAEALSTVPDHYEAAHGEELARHYSPDDAEWILMAVAMMGFLNKFMDAFGIELEQGAINDAGALIGPTGWAVGQHGWAGASVEASPEASLPPTDSLKMMIRALRHAPGAIRAERAWLAGVPKSPSKARTMIAETYGFDEPILTALRHRRPARALAGMLRNNLDPSQSELGLGAKALVGLVFAGVVGNPGLGEQSRALARSNGIDDAVIAAVDRLADAASPDVDPSGLDSLDPGASAAVALALAAAPSPAAVDQDTISRANGSLSPAQLVEAVVWLSVCQLLHRLSLYYGT